MGQREFKTTIFLILAIFFVHSFYLFFITPISNEILSIAAENKTTIPRNIFIILKDLEQEICLILFFWSVMYLIDKQLSYTKLLKHNEENIPSKSNLNRIFDIDLSLVRYISWAIPSIGFIGTVRGIGEALSKASDALAGDISGMTDSLGVAFNSTFVALFLSIFLVMLINLSENTQDKLILKIKNNNET
mgnify:CR=1 FL=1|tara:strand:+ start:7065 stop:7634 length:570 start_codon:yes stop_codon:yes gene_type:complete